MSITTFRATFWAAFCLLSLPAVAETSFLSLPAHDLTEVQPNPDLRRSVGDSIGLTLEAVALSPGSSVPLSLAPGTPEPASSTAPSPSTLPNTVNEETEKAGFEILSVSSTAADGMARLNVVLSPIQSGKLVLPSLAILDAQGKPIARTNPWNLEVVSSLSKEDQEKKQPAGLRNPFGLAFPIWVYPSAFILLALVLGALVYALYRLVKRERPKVETLIVRTEDEIALIALEDLRKQDLLSKGQFKKHYFTVSEILKTYIGARYAFDALESTTQELLQNLERRLSAGYSAQHFKNLETLFTQLDLVKFTDHVPNAGEAGLIVKEAQEFIVATRKPKPVVATSVANGGGGSSASR